jgi:hypothetical protein
MSVHFFDVLTTVRTIEAVPFNRLSNVRLATSPTPSCCCGITTSHHNAEIADPLCDSQAVRVVCHLSVKETQWDNPYVVRPITSVTQEELHSSTIQSGQIISYDQLSRNAGAVVRSFCISCKGLPMMIHVEDSCAKPECLTLKQAVLAYKPEDGAYVHVQLLY